MKPVGKPDAGNPHVRFDERGGETGLRQPLKHRASPRLYNPRIECCCQSVVFMMAATVAPPGCRNRPSTFSCLEFVRGSGFAGLPVVAAFVRRLAEDEDFNF